MDVIRMAPADFDPSQMSPILLPNVLNVAYGFCGSAKTLPKIGRLWHIWKPAVQAIEYLVVLYWSTERVAQSKTLQNGRSSGDTERRDDEDTRWREQRE
ncbi:hypothetical protein IFR05_000499 [Cadophora sp. M221]|nr:hypothetical protein IFR05_000499 [Cadophora sp. M221]